ncbi:MAG: hypothetical protein Ct9H90mP22_3470 [Gammaproteobacteria bacterium]|nr:MAG: hypothetical protein Ct9H90mP22_3470 [Gammaproteobacteria bacterium]
MRHFELDLLDMLGYGLDFERDIDNKKTFKNKKDIVLFLKRFRKTDNADLTGEDIINIKKRNLANVPKNFIKRNYLKGNKFLFGWG